ncbi:hypothetical protein Athai_67670 [Actinocatenispora thailandica]|uniref:DUF1707 domain-containing protein n=1 Tax=Actinocatenispora thailandica TaxID=227318 RepID=A0A7R7DWX9_9ACTN|nr:DUF1707 domain-containing protein [Actinocatenispora thailandica]BCJ39264.1 hypothetical protein Athai_67670 [Actinocatenispora thailandica]
MTEPAREIAPRHPREVRASDAERQQCAELLQSAHASGRLSLAEFDARVTAAYAARTRAQLAELARDLPTPAPARPARSVDPGLLVVLLVVCPPAALAYWLIGRRRWMPPGPPSARCC